MAVPGAVEGACRQTVGRRQWAGQSQEPQTDQWGVDEDTPVQSWGGESMAQSAKLLILFDSNDARVWMK